MKCEMDYGQKLSLTKNELMRVTDERERYYSIIIDSIFQIVRAKGPCDACKPHSREETCVGFPQNATCAQYPKLVEFVASRCKLEFAIHHFAVSLRTKTMLVFAEEVTGAAHGHLGRPGDVEVSDAATLHVLGVTFSQNRVRTQVPDSQPKTVYLRLSIVRFLEQASPPSSASSKSQVRAATVPVENTETIVRNLHVVGFHASARLYPQEQQVFHEWMTAPFSFPSSSPKLEQQALAAFKDLCQLPSQIQADIRHWILQTLPGAMGRPA